MSKVFGVFRRIHYNSPVVLTFTILSFAVMISSMATQGASTMYLFSAYRGSMTDPLFYVRLIGHTLGHASFSHYYGNFLLILLAGPILEEKYGSRNMLIMILFTALVTGVIHILFSETRLLGASGVVFMFILLSSFVNLEQGRIPVTLLLCIFVFIGREVADGLLKNNVNVSQLTHILGGVCGALFGFILNKKKLVSEVKGG